MPNCQYCKSEKLLRNLKRHESVCKLNPAIKELIDIKFRNKKQKLEHLHEEKLEAISEKINFEKQKLEEQQKEYRCQFCNKILIGTPITKTQHSIQCEILQNTNEETLHCEEFDYEKLDYFDNSSFHLLKYNTSISCYHCGEQFKNKEDFHWHCISEHTIKNSKNPLECILQGFINGFENDNLPIWKY